MSSQAGPPPAGDPYAAGPGGPPEDEEMREARAAYEAELARITVPDMLLQATVSLLNLAARRLAPEGDEGRDLDQVRDAIDGVRALLEILERRMPGELRTLRDALSQLQLAYAAEVQRGDRAASPGGGASSADEPGAGGGEPGAAGDESGAGGDEPGEDGGEPGEDGGEPGSGGGEPGPGGSDPGTGGGGPGAGGGAPGAPGAGGQGQPAPGPAESSGRLWVPGR